MDAAHSLGYRMHLSHSIRYVASFAVLCSLASCAGNSQMLHGDPVPTPPPSMLMGGFVDDYGIEYSISAMEWFQHPAARYHIVEWNLDGQYLIARNDSSNLSAPGRFTRIDWMLMPAMPPWEWAFCLSAYEALTAAEAERITIARRQTPLIGCNGHPFSRMQRTVPAS